MQVNMHEAKSQLSRLVEAVAAGEEVILARNGVPVAKLVTVDVPNRKRVLGQARGKVCMAHDFDRPMNDAEVDDFLGL